MNNYKLTIQYDGRNYNGWQKQGNTHNTIQSMIENNICEYITLNHLTQESIEVNGSGRTDSGVNAKAQIANFKTKYKIQPTDLLLYLNNSLPKDIRIIEVQEATLNFHARLSATGKYYSYYIDNGKFGNIFKRNYSYRVEKPLDVELMKQAAILLTGEHDFISFSTRSDNKKSTIRTIYNIDITNDTGMIRICYHGNGFLYNMVRILSGTLIEIGLGNMYPDEIKKILNKKNRAFAGPTAPANSLFLDKVTY